MIISKDWETVGLRAVLLHKLLIAQEVALKTPLWNASSSVNAHAFGLLWVSEKICLHQSIFSSIANPSALPKYINALQFHECHFISGDLESVKRIICSQSGCAISHITYDIFVSNSCWFDFLLRGKSVSNPVTFKYDLFHHDDKSIAENVPISKSVCCRLVEATWAYNLMVCEWASSLVKYTWIWLTVIVYIHKLADSVFFLSWLALICARACAGIRSLESNKQRINGKNYRFDYLHFYFAKLNYICIRYVYSMTNTVKVYARCNQMSVFVSVCGRCASSVIPNGLDKIE